MIYTKELPTETGYYWKRDKSGDSIVHVIQVPEAGWIRYIIPGVDGDWTAHGNLGVLWAGPIPKPQIEEKTS